MLSLVAPLWALGAVGGPVDRTQAARSAEHSGPYAIHAGPARLRIRGSRFWTSAVTRARRGAARSVVQRFCPHRLAIRREVLPNRPTAAMGRLCRERLHHHSSTTDSTSEASPGRSPIRVLRVVALSCVDVEDVERRLVVLGHEVPPQAPGARLDPDGIVRHVESASGPQKKRHLMHRTAVAEVDEVDAAK